MARDRTRIRSISRSAGLERFDRSVMAALREPQRDSGVTGTARDAALRARSDFYQSKIQNPKSKIQNRPDPPPQFAIHYPRYQFYEVDLWC